MGNNTMDEYGIPTENYDEYYNDLNGSYEPYCNMSDIADFGRVFLPTLYSLVSILGFLGNALVVCVLVKYRHQTTMTDVCLFNLAVADLLFVITLPLLAHYISSGRWVFGPFLCRLTAGSYFLGFYGSILFLVAMTLDRYVIIVRAHTAMAHRRSMKTGVVVSLFVWLLSALASLPTLAFIQTENDEGPTCSLVFPKYTCWEDFADLQMNVLGLLLPLLIMVACYSRIIPTLVRMRSNKKHRAIRLILVIVVIFFLFWTPYNVAVFVKFLQKRLHAHLDCNTLRNFKTTFQVTETIAFTHCCLNPVIYAFAGQKFKQRTLRLLKKWVPRWCFPGRFSRELSARRSSVVSRSSEETSTVVM